MERYTSMFWFEIFVLKLSSVFDMNLYNVIFWMFLWDFCEWFVIIFHSIGIQVKSIAYSSTRSFRDKMENMSPIKNLVLNQLGMKICLQVCRDGHFFIPTYEVEWGHSILSDCIAHGPYWSKFSCSPSMFRTWLEPEELFHKLSDTYNITLPQMVLQMDHIFDNLIKDLISDRWAS